MKSKRADSLGFQFVIVLAITIVATLIYLIWLKDFRAFGENLEDYTICKNSNIENAKLKLKVSNQVIQERIGNKCRTEYLNVPKGKELGTIAKKMAGCWDMYLEGHEELFETKDNNYCAICSVMTFEDKKQLKGLTNYLIENDAPLTGKTYYQYLTRTVVTKDVFKEIESTHLNDLHTIDTKSPQSVIFIMGKNANPGSLIGTSSASSLVWGGVAGALEGSVSVIVGYGLCAATSWVCLGISAIVGAGVGGVGGYLIGSNYGPDLDTKILLWPYTREDLSKLKCTVLEGKDTLEVQK